MDLNDPPDSRALWQKALALVAPHCDIEERLELVPPSAQIRGVYLNMFGPLLRPVGKEGAFVEYFPLDKWSSLRAYPLREYLLRLAVAGALLDGPKELHAGMHRLCKSNAISFGESLLGKVLWKFLARGNAVRACEQALAARRQTCLYGHWEIVQHAPQHIEMVYYEEYVWIESAIAGGAAGAFEVHGVQARLETRLKDRFNGSTVIQW